MKILKIFGIVVGIHVFALVLIFANPGCSATSKPTPAPTDTVAPFATTPGVSLPGTSPSVYAPTTEPAAVAFNPDAPATASGGGGTGVRFTPTRPGTPVAGALVSEPVVDVTPATTYAVKAGDSLWSIAKKHHLTVAELAAANSLAPSAALRPNQKLLIPGKPASPMAAATAYGKAGPTPKAVEVVPAQSASVRVAGDGVRHTVRSGETLGTIARKYEVKQGDIAVANNIADPAKIQAGMELIIPGWQTPAKSGKSSQKTSPAKAGDMRAPANDAPPPLPTVPSQTPSIPIIRIDESPITPAPKP